MQAVPASKPLSVSKCANALTLGLEATCLERVSKPWRFCSECLRIKDGTLRVVLCILEPRTPEDELCTGAATQSATHRAEQDHSHRIWDAGRVQRLTACLCLSPVRRALCWPGLCAESGHLGSHMSRCHSKGCTYLHVCRLHTHQRRQLSPLPGQETRWCPWGALQCGRAGQPAVCGSLTQV